MTAGLRALRALPTMLRVSLAEMVAYRAELVIWILTTTTPLVMLLVWDGAAAAGPIGDFDQPAFARYFTAGMVVRQLTSSWVVWKLNYAIRTGELAPALLKPVHPLWYRAAQNLVALPYRLAVLVPVVALLAWWRPAMGVPIGVTDLPLVALSILLAWALGFFVQVVFGSLAFYLDQSIGLHNVWFALWALLSGYLFPLSLLPADLAAVASVLPFRSMLAVPTEIAAGQLAGSAAWWAVALQAAWIAVFALLAGAVWRGGLRRWGAFGS